MGAEINITREYKTLYNREKDDKTLYFDYRIDSNCKRINLQCKMRGSIENQKYMQLERNIKENSYEDLRDTGATC